LFLTGSKFICLFRDGSYQKAHVFMNMGPIISPGNTTQMSESYSYYAAGVTTDDLNYFIGIYSHNTIPYEGRYKIGYVPSNEITFDSYIKFWPTQVYRLDVSSLVIGSNWSVAIAMIENGSYDSYVFKIGSRGNQFGSCCGILEEGGVTGDKRLVTPLGGITESLSGAPGDVMYIQNDASISNTQSDYPIALMIDTNKALVGKDIIKN
jgi:hypothetical protein